MGMLKLLYRKLSRSYFLLAIMLIVLAPIIIVSYLDYNVAKNILSDQVINKLDILADNKTVLIKNFIGVKRAEVSTVSHLQGFTELLENTGNADTLKELDYYLSYFIEKTGYLKLYLLNLNGEIIYQYPSSDEKLHANTMSQELKRTFENAKTLVEISLSNFVYQKDEVTARAFIASPVVKNSRAIGVVAFEMSNQEISKILQNNADLGNSGETIGGVINEGKLQLTAPLKDGRLSLDPNTETYNILSDAAKGQQGDGAFKDYKGNEVLAAWRYLPILRWGVLVKLDSEVALEPIQQLGRNILILSLISLGLISVVANYVSRRLEHAQLFLKKIIDSLASPLVIVNSKLQAVQWNAAAENNLKLTAGEINKKNLGDLFKFLDPYIKQISDSIHQKKIGKMDRITQESTHHEVFVYPLEQKGFSGGVVRIDDITERVNLTEGLIQNDKLASIGILTAGVAHEINNPINFIVGSIGPLKRDIDELLQVFEKYSLLKDSQNIEEDLKKIEELKNEIDLNYSVDEIGQLLASILDGGQRTSAIVKNLRSFSRLDESDMKKASIQEGMESTLNLLKSRYKDKIEIKKVYEEIPDIDCYPGKLNQVFLNLLGNAIDAMKDGGKIIIRTYKVDEEQVAVSIKDSGVGMSKETIAKIFEPFFTTKPVGQGTGLGLSISYGIIAEHKGQIKVKSEIGKGTEFIIMLPINHKS